MNFEFLCVKTIIKTFSFYPCEKKQLYLSITGGLTTGKLRWFALDAN